MFNSTSVCIKLNNTKAFRIIYIIAKKYKELENKQDISKEILKGKIDIKPYNYNKKTGCDYCNYKTICMFNTNIKGNEYNYI